MPTYEYQCDACGHKFEEFQSIMAKPIKKCPDCHKNAVKRLISAGAGVIFKGSGFYETDYRSESYKQAAKSDSAAPTKAETKSSDGKASDGKTGDSKAAPAVAAPTKTAEKPAVSTAASSHAAKPTSKSSK